MSVKRAILWLVIALPSVGIIYSIYTGQQTSHEMLHPSGELSIRFMIVAMMAGPLNDAFGPNRFFRGGYLFDVISVLLLLFMHSFTWYFM